MVKHINVCIIPHVTKLSDNGILYDASVNFLVPTSRVRIFPLNIGLFVPGSAAWDIVI
ncbi:hypothetical protein [Mesoplasma melaleucae]|uniref:hypothetical protein n=1 Tax=Mesoplasma melaleucae TaxID=81459 RepID=UPI0012EC2830|nr:hypothetical protein [Mesoplasma melaleucae]